MALTDKPWLPAAALVAVSSAVVLVAFLFEHIGGFAPCELCWYQRYAHMAGLAGALLGLYFHRQASVSATLLMVAAAAILVGVAIAGYQVGVEQTWWESSCAAPIKGDTIEELRASLLAAPNVRCDEVAWSLWQISMAGWNAILSLVMGAGGLYAAFIMKRAK